MYYMYYVCMYISVCVCVYYWSAIAIKILKACFLCLLVADECNRCRKILKSISEEEEYNGNKIN